MKKMNVAALAATALLLGGCGSDEASIADTQSAPANVQWGSRAGITYPVASASGPAKDKPIPHQFDHSPQGAIMAAFNAQTWLATADDNQWPEVSRLLVAAGKGRDQWAQARSLTTITNRQRSLVPEFKGFHVVDYDDDTALIVLAADYPSIGLGAYPSHLVWSGDDWRIVLPELSDAPDITPIKNLDTFTLFTPNSK